MGERLRARDMAILATDGPASPMQNATLEVLDVGESGFDHDRLLALIEDRIAFVPRYRQRLVSVPGGVSNPVWVDDPAFDLGYHVRRSAVPRPGSMEQLMELAARVVSRPLDRSRPLWEVYLIEGLAEGRVALLSKSHQILVDGVETVDLGQVLLDTSASPKAFEADGWRAGRSPGAAGLIVDAVRDALDRPATLLETGRTLAQGAARQAVAVRARAAALTGRSSQHDAPVMVEHLSQQRRVIGVRTDLATYRTVREAHGGTINDVVLATVTGALRNWLMTRAGGAQPRRLRALVPMSVIDDELEPTSLGTQIAGHLVELPLDEASPVVRLHQVSYSFKAHGETGQAVAANRLAGIAGFAPTTFHALGSRVALGELGRGRRFHLSVTNVPGPQFPLFAAGARMQETYPIPPLLPQHGLAIGVTSYDGGVYYGVTADRDAFGDLELFGQFLRESLDELLDTAGGTRPRARRGRRPQREDDAR